MDITTVQNKRARQVTMSLLADTITADEIEAVFDKWNVGIKGGAYILHDSDIYNEKEVKKINIPINAKLREIWASTEMSQYAKTREADELNKKIVNLGDLKPAHYHILLNFGKNAKPLGDIAKAFNTTPNMIEIVSRGMKGFASMLAYLTHNTKQAQKDGKFVYDNNLVQRLTFPDDKLFENFNSYDEFIEAFINEELEFDVTARKVLEGKYTIEEVMEKDPDYYLKNTAMIERARRAYVNSLPTPEVLFNYYIGALKSETEGSQGRIGKSIAAKVLAISLLAPDYPDVDFYNMTDDELLKKGYIYWAGGKGVALQKYDGQKVIIWDDFRGYDLIKTFGGVSKLFDALDTRPKPVPLNIKYGETYLKNSYNIITGTQTYQEFINDLSVEFKETVNSWGDRKNVRQTKEDKSQAKGRFPFFIEVTPSFVTVNAQMDYLIGSSRYNFRRTFKNDLVSLTAHSKIQEQAKILSDGYIEAQSIVLEGKEKPALPDNPMRELTDKEVYELAEKDGVILDEEILKKAHEDEIYKQQISMEETLGNFGYRVSQNSDEEINFD